MSLEWRADFDPSTLIPGHLGTMGVPCACNVIPGPRCGRRLEVGAGPDDTGQVTHDPALREGLRERVSDLPVLGHKDLLSCVFLVASLTLSFTVVLQELPLLRRTLFEPIAIAIRHLKLRYVEVSAFSGEVLGRLHAVVGFPCQKDTP